MGSDLGNVLTVWVQLQGKFPAACRQIRLDIVRCIISNASANLRSWCRAQLVCYCYALSSPHRVLRGRHLGFFLAIFSTASLCACHMVE